MWNSFSSEKYFQIPTSDESESIISENGSEYQSNSSNHQLRGRIPIVTTTILLLLSALSASFVGFCAGSRYPSNSGAIRVVSKYTPIMDEVDMNFRTIQFNGSFAHENVYRQDAGPEVDAAWEALGIGFRPVIVSDDLAAKSGLGKNHVRIKDKYGGGHPVFVEGLHQLHCLNLLRQSLFYNYEYYRSRAEEAFSDPPEVQRWHISHCLDFLRQRLMCSMDIGVFGSVWVNKTNPHTFVDFNTKHVCRDFKAIREWAKANQSPKDASGDWLEMPGEDVKIWDVAP